MGFEYILGYLMRRIANCAVSALVTAVRDARGEDEARADTEADAVIVFCLEADATNVSVLQGE